MNQAVQEVRDILVDEGYGFILSCDDQLRRTGAVWKKGPGLHPGKRYNHDDIKPSDRSDDATLLWFLLHEARRLWPKLPHLYDVMNWSELIEECGARGWTVMLRKHPEGWLGSIGYGFVDKNGKGFRNGGKDSHHFPDAVTALRAAMIGCDYFLTPVNP